MSKITISREPKKQMKFYGASFVIISFLAILILPIKSFASDVYYETRDNGSVDNTGVLVNQAFKIGTFNTGGVSYDLSNGGIITYPSFTPRWLLWIGTLKFN